MHFSFECTLKIFCGWIFNRKAGIWNIFIKLNPINHFGYRCAVIFIVNKSYCHFKLFEWRMDVNGGNGHNFLQVPMQFLRCYMTKVLWHATSSYRQANELSRSWIHKYVSKTERVTLTIKKNTKAIRKRDNGHLNEWKCVRTENILECTDGKNIDSLSSFTHIYDKWNSVWLCVRAHFSSFLDSSSFSLSVKICNRIKT